MKSTWARVKVAAIAICIAIVLVTCTQVLGREVEPVEHTWRIIRVLDGDTVQFEAAWVPDPLPKRISVRIYGIDTPEKGYRAKCPNEDTLGQQATDFTRSTVAAARSVTVRLREWDKYGGRVIGDVMVDGRSMASLLIIAGLAREYYGDAKTSWCD